MTFIQPRDTPHGIVQTIFRELTFILSEAAAAGHLALSKILLRMPRPGLVAAVELMRECNSLDQNFVSWLSSKSMLALVARVQTEYPQQLPLGTWEGVEGHPYSIHSVQSVAAAEVLPL